MHEQLQKSASVALVLSAHAAREECEGYSWWCMRRFVSRHHTGYGVSSRNSDGGFLASLSALMIRCVCLGDEAVVFALRRGYVPFTFDTDMIGESEEKGYTCSWSNLLIMRRASTRIEAMIIVIDDLRIRFRSRSLEAKPDAIGGLRGIDRCLACFVGTSRS